MKFDLWRNYNLEWLWNCHSDNHQIAILHKPVPMKLLLELKQLGKENLTLVFTVQSNIHTCWWTQDRKSLHPTQILNSEPPFVAAVTTVVSVKPPSIFFSFAWFIFTSFPAAFYRQPKCLKLQKNVDFLFFLIFLNF